MGSFDKALRNEVIKPFGLTSKRNIM